MSDNVYGCRHSFPDGITHSTQGHAAGASAIVGTSSLRRQCQLLALRPDIEIRFLRGNVNTRLAKLDAGQYDAIILASAGLIRLKMAERISQYIAPELCLLLGFLLVSPF